MWIRRGRAVIFLTLSLWCQTLPAMAGEHVYLFPYSNLYPQLKFNPQHTLAKVGVFLVHPKSHEPCRVNSAWLENRLHQRTPVTIHQEQEIAIPVTLSLFRSKPHIGVISHSDEACVVSLQIINKQSYPENKMTLSQLKALTTDMQMLIGELSETMRAWRKLVIQGVVIQLVPTTATEVTTTSGMVIKIKSNTVTLGRNTLDSEGEMIMPTRIRMIRPAIQTSD